MKRTKRFLAALMLVASASSGEVSVQKLNLASATIGEKLQKAHESGNLASELQALKALEVELAGREAEIDLIRTVIAQNVLPLVGDYAGALQYGDLIEGKPDPQSSPPVSALAGYSPVNALQEIARAARSRQVVMINEAHHVPQHRAFTLQLLAALRKEGYSWFAAETLHPDPGLAARGYPTAKTGAYIQEPLYGDLVRTALRLGYRVVPYEIETFEPGRDIEVRERAQAANLVERILKQDPKAKVLIHAGYGHISERTTPPKMMAGFFRELSGIDPLTVNQVAMTEHGSPEYEQPLYRWAVDRGRLAEPVIFRNAAGEPWTASKGADMAVFHPRSRYENGRPDWLRMGGLRSPLLLPLTCAPLPRCLVKAWATGEPMDAIPVDQVLAEAGKPAPALMLPEGRFRVRVEDAKGALIEERMVTVGPAR
jgi:hypothetical protein